jgi:uncharacterized protein (DUF952 family)
MDEVCIVVGSQVVRAPRAVWSAFLEAAALMIDTGDMFPHLEHKLGVETLDAVKALKIDLDDQNSSS